MCSTLLCSRFATSAGGAAPASLNRYTAVPGTRATWASSASCPTSFIGRSPRRIRAATNSRPRRHVVIWITRPRPTANGNQPPVGIFGTLAARNAASTNMSGASVATDRGRRPPPPVPNDAVEQQRRDHHRRGDGDAVRRREGARRAETDDEPDASDHQQPVHERHVHLADVVRRRVEDLEARQVVELHRLRRERVGTGDQRLRRDHGRHRRQDRERRDAPLRCEVVEGALDRLGVVGEQRGLPEVVQQQRRQHDHVPADLDRAATEVSHVGVQGLAAGHHQEDRAEGEERPPRMVDEQLEAVARRDRPEHGGMAEHLAQPERADHREPHDHDRAEHARDLGRAALLHGEQGDEDRDRDREDPGLERGRRHLESLDGAEHRDRRRDESVTVEERRAEHAERDDARRDPLGRHAAARHHECGEGEDPTLTLVVGTHHEREVLDRDDDDQRPEHDGRHAERRRLVDRELRMVERLAERVDRAGPDVAVDDAEGAERQRGQPRGCVPFVPGHRTRTLPPDSARRPPS